MRTKCLPQPHSMTGIPLLAACLQVAALQSPDDMLSINGKNDVVRLPGPLNEDALADRALDIYMALDAKLVAETKDEKGAA